jgi:transcriptional regulator with XRE-family HTH domain
VAESCDKAFGRYLRTLRERRRLTLDDVSSLSHTFPESISKGYLSRCENGHQKPAFSKVIALSRIYEVPADVLVERMELDLELDRVGGPDTEGLSFDELIDRGRATRTSETLRYWRPPPLSARLSKIFSSRSQ